MDWRDYQEEAAEFFRSLGLEAETDVTIQGARTKHDIDVLVKSHHAGFDITWLIECKHWKSKVSKLHVLGLREIVNDTGADRGILLAENGFQSGAIEAAALTNVHVTSLAEAANTASHEIHSMRLRELYDRLLWCKDKYWEIPKAKRIEGGLRPGVPDIGYSGDWAIKAGEDLITKGLRGNYPINTDEVHLLMAPSLIEQKLPSKIESIQELLGSVEPLVKNLENKISACKSEA
ncbi:MULTISPECIES: restriction endonuclease [unclassified Halomonas]|uniref:restriction endonuclease n=1 Tax=unclassified Halomonas TaxID=2609666 RepID=UPI002883D8FF|nr:MULTISPECIES: restriction endonuclease [unclassified Halomonas]MDT0499527.1 restriction endonuclease [Halomonas sp. PAR7]MDT0510656.1 restriction endonuclease [Halomonas sp. LES1]MDT0592331.1 restriction endonuclease [Halomonas sp. PAR8]